VFQYQKERNEQIFFACHLYVFLEISSSRCYRK